MKRFEPSRDRVVLAGSVDIGHRLALMRALRRDGLCPIACGTLPTAEPALPAEGFEYHPYRLERGVSPLADLASCASLVRLLRGLRPEIVHAFDTKPAVWVRIAARMAGVPIVIGTLPGLGSLYADESPRTRVLRAAYEPLQKLACHASDLTIAQNSDDLRTLVQRKISPARHTAVIPGSGVCTERFSFTPRSREAGRDLRAELGLGEQSTVFTMVSRLCRSKGVMEFAAAATAIRSAHPESRFLLVGPLDQDADDSLTPAELRLVRESVRWIGPRSDIESIYAASDVAVLPSYREGLPRFLMEAAAMSLPLLATDAPGCRDVVVPGCNGLTVPVRDVRALAEAAATLLQEPEKRARFGQESRRLAETRFDLRIIAGQTAAHYRRLQARTRKARVRGQLRPCVNSNHSDA